MIIQAAESQITKDQTFKAHLFEDQSRVQKKYQDLDPNGHTSKKMGDRCHVKLRVTKGLEW